jgi:uncharacterized protein
MLKLAQNGGVLRCGLPEPTGGTDYPLYHKNLDGGGMLIANSFTDEVWIASEEEVRLFGQDALLKRLQRGPEQSILREKAAQETKRVRESLPCQIAFCPTYSCNLRCVYCYQQHDTTLKKDVIKDDNLSAFFSYLEGIASKVRDEHPGRPVVIQLFGGEPLNKVTKPVIKKVFEFCRAQNIYVAITTNGVGVKDFLDILLPYHGYIAKVGISIDGVGVFHDSRRKSVSGQGTFDTIVRNINILLRAGIRVMTSLTLDKNNIGQLEPFLEFASAQGWTKNPLIELSLARVDDRKFETGYAGIMSEAELLKELLDYNARKPFPSNIRFAFLKTSLDFAKRLGYSFNQNEEGRDRFHYCWSSSELDDLVYVDQALDVYRCTYTVGDIKHSVGSLSKGFSLDGWRNHGTWSREECRQCSLGGYCCGGCKLSTDKDFERNCKDEKVNFEYLMKHIVVPKVSSILASHANAKSRCA